MARFIDADALIKRMKDGKYVDRETSFQRGVNSAIDYWITEINHFPSADVVPKSEEGAECPTCHGTGRIGTTNWLTKNMTQKQIAEEKAKAISEHERHIKAEVAREIFEEIEKLFLNNHIESFQNFHDEWVYRFKPNTIAEYTKLKKKYTESEE